MIEFCNNIMLSVYYPIIVTSLLVLGLIALLIKYRKTLKWYEKVLICFWLYVLPCLGWYGYDWRYWGFSMMETWAWNATTNNDRTQSRSEDRKRILEVSKYNHKHMIFFIEGDKRIKKRQDKIIHDLSER